MVENNKNQNVTKDEKANELNSKDHRSTHRVLNILEVLANTQNGMTFSELAESLDIPKGSIFPIIHTLCNRKYVTYIQREQRYYIGENLFNLGNKYVKNSSILNDINIEINQLSKTVGQTSYFGVLSNSSGEVLYLLRGTAPTTIQVVGSGIHFKAYSTGIGKSLLCDKEMSELKELYPDGLVPVTENTIQSFTELYNQLLNIRKTGFGYEKEESTPHIQCISTPVRYNGKLLAAMSVAFPVFNYTPEFQSFVEVQLNQTRTRVEEIIKSDISKWIYSTV